jgi:putative ATPase
MPVVAPLAERLRPKTLDEYIGQEHLIGKGKILRHMAESGQIHSMIFWGPPGVGKTTLAQILADKSGKTFFTLSAIAAGVKEVRDVIEMAKKTGGAVLFIDEIHRFSKSQQDSLLGAVEKGIITLIGATTENPSFEVIPPLLSRCQLYVLQPLTEAHQLQLVQRAIALDDILRQKHFELKETKALFRYAGGDARRLLNIIEILFNTVNEKEIIITDKLVTDTIQRHIAMYDKAGELHYDIVSAFIKSLRGSDPNAAVYYLARMIEGGEDPKFIARRMLILASEDIGNANPNALVLANACFQAVDVVGYPECSIILSQTALYLATSPKSNTAYVAINNALDLVRQTGDLPVPLHLRNAPTSLMKRLNYGKDYLYAHHFQENFAEQEFLPDAISGTKLYEPGHNPKEEEIRKNLKKWWKEKYHY